MYIFYSKKDVAKKFNSYIEDYSSMRELCSILGNNPRIVTNMLQLIIKYVLKYHFHFMKNTSNIIDCYYNALNYNENHNILNGELEDKDLKGVRIPSSDFINKLCEFNKSEEKKLEKLKKERIERLSNLIGFSEVGFTYTRPEMIHLDKDFNYYYADSTSDINYDYNKLYKDERYSNEDNNPLLRNYYDNLDSIKYSNNIQISKYGNLFNIENGRHRILYLLHHGWDVDIPCSVTRRIENKDFNIITYKLKKNYHAYIYKNNIFNDEANILIFLNNKLYKINGVDELKDFYSHIIDINYIKKYYISDFDMINTRDQEEFYRYKKELIEYLSDFGIDMLNMDFSELLKKYPKYNNQLFYEAYNQIKISFLRSRVFESEKDLSKILLDEYKSIVSKLSKYKDEDYKKR